MARSAKKKAPPVRASMLTKLLLLVLLAGIGWNLYRLQGQVAAAEAQKARLAAQVEVQQQKNDALSADIAEGTTPEKMEDLARSELGMVAPGERVYVDTSN